jgi:hypothetical protein
LLIVVDASSVVGAALKTDGIPRRALLVARDQYLIALSGPVFGEIKEVIGRRKFARVLTDDRQAEVLGLLTAAAVWVEAVATVQDCRDAKDNTYLELAAATGADVIVSSDEDLLVLHPWRGIRIFLDRRSSSHKRTREPDCTRPAVLVAEPVPAPPSTERRQAGRIWPWDHKV